MDNNNYNNENNQHSGHDTNQSQQETEHNQANMENPEKGPGLTKPVREKPPKPPKQSKPHPLLNGLVGGIVSAVIVAALFLTNIIPTNFGDEASDHSSDSSDHQDSSPVVSNTKSSDDADVSSDINETSKAVVGVINKQKANPWEGSKDAGSGSGIVYKKKDGKAYVVTNNHVVSGAQEVEVALDDDHKFKAKVLGTDELSDLAVLEIDGKDIDKVAKLGKSEDLNVGETVIAIGNPLGMEFSGSVTKGIISGLNRNVDVDTSGQGQADWSTEVIQTDAAINPGNSGGALVNNDGEVIGINSMKIAQQAVEGIGFAIPIDSAKPIIKQLENDGKIDRPFIGVGTASLDQVPAQYKQKIQLPSDVKNGMVVANIESGSPADKAGLQQFDVITKIDDKKLESILDLRKYMYNETKIGDTVKLKVYHNGKAKTVKVKLAKRKEQDQDQEQNQSPSEDPNQNPDQGQGGNGFGGLG